MKTTKRLTAIALTLVMFAQVIPLIVVPVSASEGNSFTVPMYNMPEAQANGFIAPIEPPEEGSIPISNRAELEAIKDNLSGTYHLTADIDLSGAEWVPIGDNSTQTDDSRFTGVFDGQGHVIRNLTITGEYEYAGIFGYANNATIKNIGLEETYIKVISHSSYSHGGGVCGYNNGGSISNCYNTGYVSVYFSSSIYAYSSYVGGICGYGEVQSCYNTGIVFSSSSCYAYAGGISASGDAKNCYNTGNISIAIPSSYGAYAYGGGINANGDASNCYNTGDISITSSSSYSAYAGGISADGGANNCYNTGDVSVSANVDSYVGGIIGHGSANNCYNTGNISASSYYSSCVGGIVGSMYNGYNNISVRNCYNTGSVSVSSSLSNAYAGGISGYSGTNSTINNCYNTGDVSSSTHAGGISGSSMDNSDIRNCYWNIDSLQVVKNNALTNANKNGVANGRDNTTPLTAEQMEQRSSFVTFDFDTVWGINAGINNSHPYLRSLVNEVPASYTITVEAGEGGDVTGGGTFDENATVTVTATPSEGYVFDGWYENNVKVSGEAVYSFVATANRTLEARFTAIVAEYTIKVEAGEGGTVTGDGTFEENATVTVTAALSEGYVFDGWYENNVKVSGEAVYNFTAMADRVLEARFTASVADYTIAVEAGEGGTVTGGGTFEENATVTVTATPSEGYVFDGWYEDDVKVSDDTGYSFNVTADRTLEARFIASVAEYTMITIEAGEGGTVSGGGTFDKNTTVMVTAAPSEGYVFDGWYENNIKVSGGAVYSFVATANRTLEARFTASETDAEAIIEKIREDFAVEFAKLFIANGKKVPSTKVIINLLLQIISKHV